MTVDRYAVFGDPIAHSLSPQIHTDFARQRGEMIRYEAIQVTAAQLPEAVHDFFAGGGAGLNVTVPLKAAAYTLAQQCTDYAKAVAVVNTLWRSADGTVCGDNTDGPGLLDDLRAVVAPLIDAQVLLVGAGGAAQGVALALCHAGIAALTVVNRTSSRAAALVERLRPMTACPLDWQPITAVETPFDLVVHATSAGLCDETPVLSPTCVDGAFVLDMSYSRNVTPTAFCRWAMDAGAVTTRDGLGMLVRQAALSFARWRGWMPDAEATWRRLDEARCRQ